MGEIEQIVGGAAHGADHHDHIVAATARADDVIGDGADPVGVGN